MSRDGLPVLTDPDFDPRIPFPHTDLPLPCRTSPELYKVDHLTYRPDLKRAMAKVVLSCAGCPIVQGCLKFALANPELSSEGIWAGTTVRQRAALRERLVMRLGPDWVGVVAERDRAARLRREAPRTNPPPRRDAAMARLELEAIPVRPAPHEPWREPLTKQQQAQNRRVLEAALTRKAVA